MTRFFPTLYLDISSFWAGAILVIVLLVLYLRFRRAINAYLARTLQKLIDFRESLSIASDSDYIQILYKYVQKLHLLGDSCPLSDVLIPPFCSAPPPYLFPGQSSLDTSLIHQSIGYDPLVPDLGSAYFGPQFPLFDALQERTNLCLVGFPGSGKTAAIAGCIIDLIKQRHDEENPSRLIPFYVKANHLISQFPDSNIMGVLLKSIQSISAFQLIPNFPKYLTASIRSDQAVLFIDDMDLLTPGDLNTLGNFILAIRGSLPSLQIVATASPSCLGNLKAAGLEFISIIPWGADEKRSFLKKLSLAWPKFSGEPSDTSAGSDQIRCEMLVVSDQGSSALEFTCKALAAYAGDIQGPLSPQAVQSYIARKLTGHEDMLEGMELLALYCLQSQSSAFSKRDIQAWISDVYRSLALHKPEHRLPPLSSVLQAGLDAEILESSGGDRYYFKRPTLAGFLAARGLTKLDRAAVQAILAYPDWPLMRETMRLFAWHGDVKPYLASLLKDGSLLRGKLLRAALWIPYLKKDSPEEIALLKRATQEIQSNPLTLTKLRLVFYLSRSGNPTIKSIFQYLQKSPDPNTRRAAAVGLGLIRDLSAVPYLITQLNDEFPSDTAACYALGRIGSPRSLEAVAEALLHGTELLRRAAAESLAQNRSEGHPALREGATREDLLVRYAVVHGLSLIPEDWSLDILDKMRIDEKEWVVRDLAQQSYQHLRGKSPYLPQHLPPVQKAPWMLKFASEQDLPAPDRENALDFLLKALKGGSAEQKQDALAYLARLDAPEAIPDLLQAAQENTPLIAAQAELAIWYIAPTNFSLN